MDNTTIFKRSDDVVFRKIEDEYILVPLEAAGSDVDSLYNMNPTGGAIWEKIDGKKTIGDIVDELLDEYEQDRATIEREVATFIAEIRAAGLLAVV